MSKRTAEASKAIKEAWEKERQLVLDSKGTRDWTPEQQQSIIDKGKAYDDQGRAFEGQHMKSAAEYPEYQGSPDNIQFLTKEEHLQAHKGNWQNPTNWYYDPVTKEYFDFGDGEIIPCKVIDLYNPIAKPLIKEIQKAEEVQNSLQYVNKRAGSTVSSRTNEVNQPNRKTDNPKGIPHAPIPPMQPQTSENEGIVLKCFKRIIRFANDHPVAFTRITGALIERTEWLASSFGSGNRKNNSAARSNPSTSSQKTITTDVVSQIVDIVEKVDRASPCENDVSGHKQRYHTKDGIEWKDKKPYHRRGKNS